MVEFDINIFHLLCFSPKYLLLKNFTFFLPLNVCNHAKEGQRKTGKNEEMAVRNSNESYTTAFEAHFNMVNSVRAEF
jgi:hypothetical protein